jgi:hypothetical protein
MRAGTLIRVAAQALVDDKMVEHGPLWMTTHDDDNDPVHSKAIATGKKWCWYEYEFSEAPPCNPS